MKHHETRFERGRRMLHEFDGNAGQAVIDSLADVAPEFAHDLFEYPFGDVISRPELGLREREIATIAALCARKCHPAKKPGPMEWNGRQCPRRDAAAIVRSRSLSTLLPALRAASA